MNLSIEVDGIGTALSASDLQQLVDRIVADAEAQGKAGRSATISGDMPGGVSGGDPHIAGAASSDLQSGS